MLLEEKYLPKVPFERMNEVHLRELEILNNLYRAIEKGDIPLIGKLLEDLLEDVKGHFSYEEDLMKKTQFFAYEIHKAEHDRVLKELNLLRDWWNKNKDPKRLGDYLKHQFVPWLIEHIQTMDTATATYLRNFIPINPK